MHRSIIRFDFNNGCHDPFNHSGATVSRRINVAWPFIRGGDLDRRPNWSAVKWRHDDGCWRINQLVASWWRVVIRVSKIPFINQLPEPGNTIDRKRAADWINDDIYEAVCDRPCFASVKGRWVEFDWMGRCDRLEWLPTKPVDWCNRCCNASDPWLIDRDFRIQGWIRSNSRIEITAQFVQFNEGIRVWTNGDRERNRLIIHLFN